MRFLLFCMLFKIAAVMASNDESPDEPPLFDDKILLPERLSEGGSLRVNPSVMKDLEFPIVLPNYNRFKGQSFSKKKRWGSCLFYSEGISVVVYNKNSKNGQYATANIHDGDAVWEWIDDDVSCADNNVGSYNFTIRIKTLDEIPGYNGAQENAIITIPRSTFTITLQLHGGNLGWWHLKKASAVGLRIEARPGNFLEKNIRAINDAPTKTVDYINMNSIHGFAWGCHSSQALFFPVADDNSGQYLIGVSFYNTEIQPVGAVSNETENGVPKTIRFSSNMEDCKGTFSVGSLTGILSSVVLFIPLIFAILMLHSVKTTDRFDNPKQKLFAVNARE